MGRDIAVIKPTPAESITEFLATGLAFAKDQVPGLSIRSLAQRLELSASYLSKIFNGKKPLPPHLVKPLAKALRFDSHQTARLQRMVLDGLLDQFEGKSFGSEASVGSGLTVGPLDSYEPLGKQDFWLLETWYLIPLLNLLTVKGVSTEPKALAMKLGVPTRDIERALECLLQSGHLKRGGDGRILRTRLKVRFPTDRSHSSIRAYHREMINRALAEVEESLSGQGFSERLVSGLSLAGDSKKMAEARRMLEESLYRIADFISSGECDDVFQINLQFFKVTK